MVNQEQGSLVAFLADFQRAWIWIRIPPADLEGYRIPTDPDPKNGVHHLIYTVVVKN